MKPCDKRTIKQYEIAIGVGGAHKGAALYCKECDARLVYRNGAWKKEEV